MPERYSAASRCAEARLSRWRRSDVSYALDLVADARRALASLAVDVQEAVFDALDRVADEADGLPPDDVDPANRDGVPA